jgi:hypothetical protein
MMWCEEEDLLGEHSDRLCDLLQLAPKTVVPRVAAVILEVVQELVPVLVSSMLQHMCLDPMTPHYDACICSYHRNVQ